ncbi:unnamed protein product [Ilex paraguariensis]|uniref:RRM domain-containing protein n=1 Tax=Ilex paraguariensis TaxID=185542 RepID=A0ABC8SB37_9AQUA
MDMAEPSKVIHVRNVGHEISESDLLQLFQPFGVITKLVMLRAKNQALLQMQDVNSAINALQFYTNVQPSVRGRNVYVQFSSHQELTTMDQNSQARVDAPNRILLVTIHHMLYPITVEVLHQVFSPHGLVEKIVTFQKSAGFQALIQYQLRQSAVAARNSLQGRNIYDGCCQLDVQFSNLDELQVNYNNERSRDFTNPSLPSEQKGRSSQPYGDVYALQASGARAVGFQQVGMAWVMLSAINCNEHAPQLPDWYHSEYPISWFPDLQLTLFFNVNHEFYGYGCNPIKSLTKSFPNSLVPAGPSVKFLTIGIKASTTSQMGNAAAIAAAFGGGLPPGISGTNDRCTVLVSNLDPEFLQALSSMESWSLFFNLKVWVLFPILHCGNSSCSQRIDEDKLFNLFSIYGNIVRIKLLRNKPDHALVQMGDGFQAELAVHFLKV